MIKLYVSKEEMEEIRRDPHQKIDNDFQFRVYPNSFNVSDDLNSYLSSKLHMDQFPPRNWYMEGRPVDIQIVEVDDEEINNRFSYR